MRAVLGNGTVRQDRRFLQGIQFDSAVSRIQYIVTVAGHQITVLIQGKITCTGVLCGGFPCFVGKLHSKETAVGQCQVKGIACYTEGTLCVIRVVFADFDAGCVGTYIFASAKTYGAVLQLVCQNRVKRLAGGAFFLNPTVDAFARLLVMISMRFCSFSIPV